MKDVEKYLEAGLTPIPIKVGSKAPPLNSNWQTIPAKEQWENIGNSETNIALLCGNGFVVADGDNAQTVANLEDYFKGLGIYENIPEVVSAHPDHRHYYLKIIDAPSGETWHHLTPEIGKGELRISESYVIAPGSTVNMVEYQFLKGSPETYQAMQAIKWNDISCLIPKKNFSTTSSINSMKSTTIELTIQSPVRLIHREMPFEAKKLLYLLQGAKKSQKVSKYSSRSEAEAAVVSDLYLCGLSYKEIVEIFENSKPKHYMEQGNNRLAYLETTYRNVVNNIVSDPNRIQIAQIYNLIPLIPWPGIRGENIKDISSGLCTIGWQFASTEICASVRDLAEYSGLSIARVSRTIKQLLNDDLLEIVEPHTTCKATKYDISKLIKYTTDWNISHSIEASDLCSNLTQEAGVTWENIELFSVSNYGQTCKHVYQLLNVRKMTEIELAKKTGLNLRTIQRNCKKLKDSGLAKREDSFWMLGDTPLDEVADHYNARGRSLKRRKDFKDDRIKNRDIVIRSHQFGNNQT